MKTRKHTLIFLLLITCANLTAQAQGQLWGTTRKGGFTGGGTILKTNADASDYYEIKKEWYLDTPGSNPQATLLYASDGKIYGVTPSGGATGGGVLFETSLVGGPYYARWHFSETYDGSNPQGGLVQSSNGKIYGLTSKGTAKFNGALFEYDPTSLLAWPKFQLTPATGTTPRGSMVATPDGKIYGVCRFGGSADYGVLFEYDPAR